MFQSAYWQQNCKGHCDSMLGSLSSLGELVKLLIILLSEDSTQNKLGPGLKITAGHRTMSGQIRNLTGQIFYSPVMLTGHIQQSHRNKRKVPRSSVVCDEL